MKTQAFNVKVRRLATGCDYSFRLFAADAFAAETRAKTRAGRAEQINPALRQDAFRVVSCEVSADQSRPVLA